MTDLENTGEATSETVDEPVAGPVAAPAVKANGHARPVVVPPTALKGKEPHLSVLIGVPLESDGSLPLRISADAIDACRGAWSGICLLHEEVMGKVSVFDPEPAAQLKSRKLAFEQQQRALRHADGALGEIRAEVRQVEDRLRQKTVPVRGQGDLAGALVAGEIQGWLRGHGEAERFSLVERAIGRSDARVVAAALEMPAVAGLDAARADLLRDAWQKRMAPEELARLEQLAKVSERVQAAADALMRRYQESFDHSGLDRLEAQHKAA